MEDALPSKSLASVGDTPSIYRSPSLSLGAMDMVGDHSRPYFCVIDRFCHGGLDVALAHVGVHHWVEAKGELLVRTRMIGGGR